MPRSPSRSGGRRFSRLWRRHRLQRELVGHRSQPLAQKQVTFGASEIGYSTGQANDNPSSPYQYLPDVAGATCLMYNVKGRLGNQLQTLLLNSQSWRNWTGTVRTGTIRQSPPSTKGSPCPNAPIAVVFRTDASGENYLFSSTSTTCSLASGSRSPRRWDTRSALTPSSRSRNRATTRSSTT